MCCDVRQMLVERVRVGALDGIDSPQVKSLAAQGGEVAEQRLSNELVLEGQPPAILRDQQPGRFCLFERGQQVVLWQL